MSLARVCRALVNWIICVCVALAAARVQSQAAPSVERQIAAEASPPPTAPAPVTTDPDLAEPDLEDDSAPIEPAQDPEPAAHDAAGSADASPIRYRLERVRVRSNRMRAAVIKNFVTLKTGALFDVDDPAIEEIRWRLLGTGWFNDVKLSLVRGSQRGWVVLVIDVRERNTLIVDQFAMGLARAITSSKSTRDTLRPYVGLGLAETNAFGLGVSLSGTVVLTPQQYGLNFGYFDPRFTKSGFSLSGRFFHNYAREFFGRYPLVAVGNCPAASGNDDEDNCDPDVQARRAVVIYRRTGLGIGTGHEIASRLRYTLDWLGEYVNVLSMPLAASTQRGSEVVPIDFRIQDGSSIVSSLRFGLVYDSRDHPALPTRGDYYSFNARLASRMFGSDYDFVRFELGLRHWTQLPWHHVLNVGFFLGSVFGNAPFFYNFYAADLSDLLPARLLELNLDRRRTLNLLGTSIVEMDMEDLASRLDFQYLLPVRRGRGFLRGLDAYIGGGVFLLAHREDLRTGIPGYHGFSRLPIDLTFDLGVRADTEIGLIKVGFSSLIGFSNLGRENP